MAPLILAAMNTYERGLCDGLELAAGFLETLMEYPTIDRQPLQALLTVVREAQLDIQVGGL